MKKLTEIQLATMLMLQERMNGKVDPDWRDKGFKWENAIFTEATEAFNHTNWPWWKKEGTGINLPQLKLELVDIAHFLLSDLMEKPDLNIGELLGLVTDTVNATCNELRETGQGLDIETNRPSLIQKALKKLIIAACEDKLEDILINFVLSMYVTGFDWPELYKMYVGKNTLNRFRQDHGYKTDTKAYKDLWLELVKGEDNDFLEVLLASDLNSESDTYSDQLYAALSFKFKGN